MSNMKIYHLCFSNHLKNYFIDILLCYFFILLFYKFNLLFKVFI